MVWLVLAAALYLTLASALFGTWRSGYSALRDTLSELGEEGAPRQRAVSWGVFLPVGLALLIVAGWALPRVLAAASLALALAIGYLGAALFPCDRGAPLRGSRRQALHSVAGAIEYGGGLGALMALALQLEQMYFGPAALVAAAIAGLSLRSLSPVRGLLQRLGEAALFAALAWALID